MTGFGRCELSENGYRVRAEVKSVNHRFLDILFRGGRDSQQFEEVARTTLKDYFSRGHVEVRIEVYNDNADALRVHADLARLGAWLAGAREIAEHAAVPFQVDLASLLTKEEFLRFEENDESFAKAADLVQRACAGACAEARTAREREGSLLWRDISSRLEELQRLITAVRERQPELVSEHETRLRQRIEGLLPEGVEPDPIRILQEVALAADKQDIAEEIARLEAHLSRLRQFSERSGPQGRSMDFLVQELNRELNTIASKTQDISIANLVLDAKGEVEKIREQVQNIE